MRFRLSIISAVLLTAVLAAPALAIDKYEVWSSTQLYVKDPLIAPDEAKFSPPSWLRTGTCQWMNYKDTEWMIRSWVEAPKTYGQKARTYFYA